MDSLQAVVLFLGISGVIDEIILEGRCVHKPCGEFKKDPSFINGLSDYHLQLREHIKVSTAAQVTKQF